MFVRIANLPAVVATFCSGLLSLFAVSAWGETLGEYWDTAEEESKYYRIVEIPMPAGVAIEAGCFEVMPDNQLAIGTRRGDIFWSKEPSIKIQDLPTSDLHMAWMRSWACRTGTVHL